MRCLTLPLAEHVIRASLTLFPPSPRAAAAVYADFAAVAYRSSLARRDMRARLTAIALMRRQVAAERYYLQR